MASPYIPQDWYWIVGNDLTRAFSSAVKDYVQPDSSAYRAWLVAGNVPTAIASEAELGEVLAEYSIRPSSAGLLDGFQERQTRELTVATVAKILMALTNEVRALKGQPALNAAQFRAYVKSQL